MVDLSDVVEVRELVDVEEVNRLIDSGDWAPIAAAPGQKPDRSAYILYSLGRRRAEKIEWEN